MNWINSFEILCYFIVFILVVDILKSKNYRELGLLISGALAGFCLELLAVRFTDIYHYSNDFFISIGFYPYQFPFFGGLMWGGISVCALRIANKFSISNVMKALLSGWLIVSMDLLLDVVAIRLNGGFWVWDGRPITLAINHHMFMSVIWINFLGYMFEVPAIIGYVLLVQPKSIYLSSQYKYSFEYHCLQVHSSLISSLRMYCYYILSYKQSKSDLQFYEAMSHEFFHSHHQVP